MKAVKCSFCNKLPTRFIIPSAVDPSKAICNVCVKVSVDILSMPPVEKPKKPKVKVLPLKKVSE